MTYLDQIEEKLSHLLSFYDEKKSNPTYRIRLAFLMQEKRRLERSLDRLKCDDSTD